MAAFDQRGQIIGQQNNSKTRDSHDQRGQVVGTQQNTADRRSFERWWSQEQRPSDPKEAAWLVWQALTQ